MLWGCIKFQVTNVGNVSILDCGKQFYLSIVPPIADSHLQAVFPPPFRHLGSPCNYAGLFLKNVDNFRTNNLMAEETNRCVE